MLIGDTWEYFQSDIAHGGHWLTFGDAVDNFWDPASKTLAELAIDAVDAFFTPERAEEQKHPWCKRCWYRIEKPVLIASLKSTNNPKVTEIRKYLQVKNGAPHFDGFIKEMSD
ncbi:hypothetical protein AK830_g11414 [Neonectria ditissima]|uniref:Uncharacterized protein n=1 Tax=Neonectria ditissima TaxID=78410 RepID=A0A0P7B1G6_9HYPO|nr:hypothetical protein AK830_g11414 [Neonectria ditissima]